MLGAHRTIFLQQRFPSGPTIGWWSGCGLWTSLNTLPTWEAVVCTEAWWWDSLPGETEILSSKFPLLKRLLSLFRFWSPGSMWRPWLCCWTSHPTRHCCAATSPHILTCSLAQRPSSSNRSVLKTQTTLCLPPPLKWRYESLRTLTGVKYS